MANRTYHPRNIPVHGYAVTEHPFYMTWCGMLSRCETPTFPGYPNYGGRGIKVCRRWYHFENFANDMWPRPHGAFTLERVDNSKGYSKSNCRWATRSDQCVNRRTFKNNTSGFTGVVPLENGRYIARFDYEHVRYHIGRFDTAIDAAEARVTFVDMFFDDREKAVASVSSETLWCTSSTGVRGVTVHPDGGYIVRVTLGGIRHYVGYFQTVEEAADARANFIASRTVEA